MLLLLILLFQPKLHPKLGMVMPWTWTVVGLVALWFVEVLGVVSQFLC